MKEPLRRRALTMFVHARRVLLNTCVLYLVAISVLISPLTANADSYPTQTGWQVITGGPFADTQPNACAAWSAVNGGGWQDADYTICGGVQGPHYCYKFNFGCHPYQQGPYCPSGGTRSGNICVGASSCPSGQVRDPNTGACGDAIPEKALGCHGDLVGNPCNVGTGTKFQVEPLYRGATAVPLIEQGAYNTRFDTSIGLGALGKGWAQYVSRSIVVLPTGVATMWRADGSNIAFYPPASGNIYLPDADIADRLQRLTNGSGQTTGWKLTSSLDDSTELYNANGVLLSISDRAGNALTVGFSDSSTPLSIAPGPGYIISLSDPWGRTIHYAGTVKTS